MHLVDLHTHLLPGLDDGPRTLADSVAMLERSHASGTRAMVATPHLFHPLFPRSTRRQIEDVFDQTVRALEGLAREREELASLGEIELGLGAENYFSSELLAALDEGSLLTLNQSRYALIEFSPYFSFQAMEKAVERVLSGGYFPLLAHVERYAALERDPGRLSALVEMGCATQINAASVLAPPLSALRRLVRRLLKADLVSVVASDAHDVESRSDRLAEAASLLGRRWNERDVEEWTSAAPSRIAGFQRSRQC